MEIKTYGLLLSTTIYGEKDKLCNLVTLEEGRICAKLVSYAKSKIRLCGEAFCFGEYILSKINSHYIIVNCSIIDSFMNCWQSIEKNICACVVVEILDKLSNKSLNIKEEFFMALNALKNINYKDTFPLLFVIKFFIKLFKSLGIDINNYNFSYMNTLKSIIEIDDDFIETLEIYKHEIVLILKNLYFIFSDFSDIKVLSLEKLLNSNFYD